MADATQGVNITKMFPRWPLVTATREGSIAHLRFHGLDGSIETEQINIDAMYQALHDLRALGPQTRSR